MKIFNNWYKELKELRDEVRYYSHENYLKEERYRKLNKEYKELEKENKELKGKLEKLTNPKRRGKPRKDGNK